MKEVANCKLRILLAYNEFFMCTDVRIGDTAPYQKSMNRKIALRRRPLVRILDIDETGVAVKFQSRTFEVARFCLRRTVEEKDVGEVE